MSRKYGWSGAAVAAMREAMIGPAAMEINRRKYDSGDKSILLDVLQRCFVARIDPPEWVKNGMVQSISELNSGLSDANDVFGVDPKTLRSLRDQRLIRKHAVRVHNALFNLRLEGRSMAADDALDQVASDLKLPRRLVEKIYNDGKRFQSRIPIDRTDQSTVYGYAIMHTDITDILQDTEKQKDVSD